jgi:P4 family phage/plasmid primase-like protien
VSTSSQAIQRTDATPPERAARAGARMTRDQALALLETRFFNRTDRVAVLMPDWNKPSPVQPQDLRALLLGHMLGERAPKTSVKYQNRTGSGVTLGRFKVGSYAPGVDGLTRWMCIDFDGAGHAHALADPLQTALQTQEKLNSLGLTGYLERSGSAKGYHLWCFFDPPIPAADAHALGHQVVPTDAKLASGELARAGSCQGIEVFPKQASITDSGSGNMVWLPFWSGAAAGGARFYAADPDGLVPLSLEQLVTHTAEQVRAVLTPAVITETSPAPRPAVDSWADWRTKALAALPLAEIYGRWLTGKVTGNGWLECRDPASPSGDRTPSAGVADGSGQAVRGCFHSFVTGKNLSVFDFLTLHGGQPDFASALKSVAQLSGVPLPAQSPSPSEVASWRNSQPVAAGEDGYAALTDVGNAERLVRQQGESLRYCHLMDSWFHWGQTRWLRDQSGEVIRRAIATARLIPAEKKHVRPANPSKESDQKRYTSECDAIDAWAKRSEDSARISAMVKLGQSHARMAVLPEVFDADVSALNLLNGTLDLKTGELRPHRREDLHSKQVAIAFDPKATCPRWLQFLEEVFVGDEELIAFVQRAMGYSLTGSTKEQCFFICYGIGENGKSRTIQVLEHLLGEYGTAADIETLASKEAQPGSIRSDLVRLRGARLVTTTEPEQRMQLSEALLKKLTGEDQVVARAPYEREIVFTPAFKLWMMSNHRPRVKESNHGFWRRVRLIPFQYRVPASRKDPQLLEKLKAEAPGILNWAVKGCLDWQRMGLGAAEAITRATQTYRAEMDGIGRFLLDCCEQVAGATVSVAELYDAYRAWCVDCRERPMTKNQLGTRLTERGIEEARTREERCWADLRLRIPGDTGAVSPDRSAQSRAPVSTP